MRAERKKLHSSRFRAPRAGEQPMIKRKVFKTSKQKLVCFMLTSSSFNDTDSKRISFLTHNFLSCFVGKENNFNSFIHR